MNLHCQEWAGNRSDHGVATATPSFENSSRTLDAHGPRDIAGLISLKVRDNMVRNARMVSAGDLFRLAAASFPSGATPSMGLTELGTCPDCRLVADPVQQPCGVHAPACMSLHSLTAPNPKEKIMNLLSSAFADGAHIPRRFTCDGDNRSPPLQWSGAPAGTQSFALLCDDPDTPSGTWHHWAAYDIPASVTELAENAAQDTKMKQAINDFRKSGYGGPCPPHGHGRHHYHIRLLALSMDHLRISPASSCRDVETEARRHMIAEATLVGWYER
ncbi:MAG: YbhB/YbcL family Raf kinase inhibitor-like protein [Pseudomonadota bacterium]